MCKRFQGSVNGLTSRGSEYMLEVLVLGRKGQVHGRGGRKQVPGGGSCPMW